MRKIVCEKELAEAIGASIENYEWCIKKEEKKRNFSYVAKYMLWIVLLIALTPRKRIFSKKMVCAITPVNKKLLFKYADKDELFCFAKLNDTPSLMKHNISVFSPYIFKERIVIAINAYRFYLKYRNKLKGYIHFVLEYYGIADFIDRQNIDTIISPCMYERYSTFITHYAKSRNLMLIGVQDGAAIDINVPSKVYCNKMYCFDEYEASILRKFIGNSDCQYVYIGFKSTLKWKSIEKDGMYVIAVASQDWFTSKTINLLETLLDAIKGKKIKIIVFPHYRENWRQYLNIKKRYPELLVEMGERYSNIDLLITFYSTIVYDFWSVNPKLKVKCLRIPGYEAGYYGRSNVEVYDEVCRLVESI